MTYPLREDLPVGRTLTVTDDERRILLRLLDAEWWKFDSDGTSLHIDKQPATLLYMRDVETLQAKLK